MDARETPPAQSQGVGDPGRSITCSRSALSAITARVKKLCFICEATQGGVRKHLRDLIRVFSRPEEGLELHAILGDRGEPGLHAELEQLARANGNLRWTFVPELRRALNPLSDLRAYARVKELLRAIAPEIVHTHSAKAGYIGRTAAHHLAVPRIVHTAHVFPFQWARGLRGRVYLALERQVARFTHTLICVGESQRDDALARGLAPPGKFRLIRNGIEIPAGAPSDGRAIARAALEIDAARPAVGMVARLAPQKGLNAFLQAAQAVLASRPDVVFCVVGGGPLEADIRRRAIALKLSADNFRVLGHREDAAQLYAAFDVLTLSSLYEGLPYVLLEAMAWGVPVVATDVLGSRDVVVDGTTGFLARVNDPAHIAEHTLRLLGDAALRARFGAAARQRVAGQFSFTTFIDGHRQLYAHG